MHHCFGCHAKQSSATGIHISDCSSEWQHKALEVTVALCFNLGKKKKKEIFSASLSSFTSFPTFSPSFFFHVLISLVSLHFSLSPSHTLTHTHTRNTEYIICQFPSTWCAMYKLSQQGPLFEWLSDFCYSDNHPLSMCVNVCVFACACSLTGLCV